MFSYISSSLNKFFTSILTSILKNGGYIPKSIGIIMDEIDDMQKKNINK